QLLTFVCARPARLPRVPYATLFRSHHVLRLWRERRHVDSCPEGRFEPFCEGLADRRDFHLVEHDACPGVEDKFAFSLRHAGGLRDRKSTRLNSSHVKNSYAGFCLKK